MVKESKMQQTEIGLLPEDWVKAFIKNIAPLQRGFDLPISTIQDGPFPVVFSNGINKHHNKFMIKGPGIVTGRSGTIGKVFYIEGDFWPHNTSLFVTSFNDVNPRYVYYLYNYIDFNRFSSGSGVPTLNRNDIHDTKIPLPPLPEQEAIASALSDADAWIESLEQLIAKKRLIKQGAMQELLMPKEGWEVKKLGEIGSFISTNSYSRDMLNYTDGDILNIHYGDIHTQFNSHFDITKERVPFINRDVKNISVNYCISGDLIIADASENEDDIGKSIEIINTNELRILAGLHTLHYRPKQGVFRLGFLGHLWKSYQIHSRILKESQGTKVLGISASRIIDVEILFPSLTEQTRIATILSDMDADLEALAKQLAKAKKIKQGMMQELLTGRIRLV